MLSFWHKYSLEYSSYDGTYDRAYVDASTDGGLTWANVASWKGDLSTWTQQIVDLGSYTGNAVKLRFRVRDSYGYSGNGWYIDYVEVCESE